MIDFDTLSKTVGDLSKLIVAKGFKKSPKVQKIAKSGHTDADVHFWTFSSYLSTGTIFWVKMLPLTVLAQLSQLKKHFK